MGKVATQPHWVPWAHTFDNQMFAGGPLGGGGVVGVLGPAESPPPPPRDLDVTLMGADGRMTAEEAIHEIWKNLSDRQQEWGRGG